MAIKFKDFKPFVSFDHAFMRQMVHFCKKQKDMSIHRISNTPKSLNTSKTTPNQVYTINVLNDFFQRKIKNKNNKNYLIKMINRTGQNILDFVCSAGSVFFHIKSLCFTFSEYIFLHSSFM